MQPLLATLPAVGLSLVCRADPSEARAPQDPQHHLRRIARCRLHRPILAGIRTTSGCWVGPPFPVRQSWGSAQIGLDRAPNSDKLFDRARPIFVWVRPKPGRCWPNFVELGRLVGRARPTWAELVQNWVGVGSKFGAGCLLICRMCFLICLLSQRARTSGWFVVDPMSGSSCAYMRLGAISLTAACAQSCAPCRAGMSALAIAVDTHTHT